MRAKAWFEEYRCGCVSEDVPRKRDLPGYCPKHGEDRVRVWPVMRDADFRRIMGAAQGSPSGQHERMSKDNDQ